MCINRDLLSELRSHLKEVKKGRSLALLIDGADLVHDSRGQRISEWIPQHVPTVIHAHVNRVYRYLGKYYVGNKILCIVLL